MKYDLRNLLDFLSILVLAMIFAVAVWLVREGYKKDNIEENETIEIESNGRSGVSNIINMDFSDIEVLSNDDDIVGDEEPERTVVNAIKLRCTNYLVTGTTASGEQTRYGILAGKREWLYRYADLYSVGDNGELGEFIGTFQFLDTGAGIDTDGDGYGDSIINGISIDVWQPSESAMYDWINTYGDYVYMELKN